MINAGKYNKKIQIVKITLGNDIDGFATKSETVISEPFANIITTKGYTLIASNSDFEKAYTNFTIRYSQTIINNYEAENRNLQVIYNGKHYSIEYLNNINEANEEIEIQAKVVKK